MYSNLNKPELDFFQIYLILIDVYATLKNISLIPGKPASWWQAPGSGSMSWTYITVTALVRGPWSLPCATENELTPTDIVYTLHIHRDISQYQMNIHAPICLEDVLNRQY